MLPYGKQTIEQDDIDAVLAVLESDWLTTGPMVNRLETEFAAVVGAGHAVAVSSGTAALHAAMFAAGIGLDDEVIVPAISFVATANAALYEGATPVFADVDPETLLIDPADVARKITPNTKAIVAMDYAGQPCDYRRLREIATQHDLILIADACHSMGARYDGKSVGSLADFNCFSLHPVKPITSGEGGLVTTDNALAAERMRVFRNHGITTDHRQRQQQSQHRYAMQSLGFNYRLTDIQCALAVSQLGKLSRFTQQRQDIAGLYELEFKSSGLIDVIEPLRLNPSVEHAYHLYVVRLKTASASALATTSVNSDATSKFQFSRDDVFSQLRDQGIGVNVHYQPMYQHPYYQRLMPNRNHQCPNAERVYEQILSLPIFPAITPEQIKRVVNSMADVLLSRLACPMNPSFESRAA